MRAEIGLSKLQYAHGNGYAVAWRFGKSLSYDNTIRCHSCGSRNPESKNKIYFYQNVNPIIFINHE